MHSITVNAPCKINLSLDIVKRLPNGYHEMNMVMQSVSLSDTLTLSLKKGSGQITMDCVLSAQNAALACDESNIAVRCARAFLAETGLSLSENDLHIHLVKNIPMMAGLGGGSADGAAVLYGLNVLLGANLSLQQLENIGVKIGADIPFCVRGGTLQAQGIGEVFTALSPMPDIPIVIVKPRFGISTKDAFGRCDSLSYRHAEVDKMIGALQAQNPAQIADSLQNVFEELCSPKEAQNLQQIHDLLKNHGAQNSLLSGSGSAVFGLFQDEETAKACVEALSSHPLLEGVFLCRPILSGVSVL